MNRTPQPRPRPSSRTGWKAGAVCVGAAAALLAFWGGCTVTKDNYHTLSFFFDGVPDPNAPLLGAEGRGDSTMTATVTVHKPFAEEKCDECHKTQYKPSRNDPRACLTCHDKVGTEHKWTHGAVAGGACLWCHAPHESARKWLLRSQDRKLCGQCHSATMMNSSTVPAHTDPNIGCIDCHFGHGGDDPLMLKPGATANAPPPAAEPEQKESAPPTPPPTPPREGPEPAGTSSSIPSAPPPTEPH